MSTKGIGPSQYVVRCDHCPRVSESVAPSAREALEVAWAEEGWERVNIADHCPRCLAKLSSKV